MLKLFLNKSQKSKYENIKYKYNNMKMLSPMLLLALCKEVIGDEYRIHNADELIEFSSNTGKYKDVTVYLDSDIEFTEALSTKFKPIGYYKSKDLYSYFHGTFDGQGHTISNLKINSDSYYVGLFGYSKGTTIKNVVLDSSCSIESAYSFNSMFIGGIIGYCISYNDPCIIENNVNMASIAYKGTADRHSIYLGGIAGYLEQYTFQSITYSVYAKNCANYGSLEYFGSGRIHLGGIIGYLDFDCYVRNCLNYGTIIYNGTFNYAYAYVGGIIGYNDGFINNCVNAGLFVVDKAENTTYLGSIAGATSHATFLNCYWDKTISYNVYGYAPYSNPEITDSASFNGDFELNETISIGSYSGSSLIDAVNAFTDHYILYDCSHWILNKNENNVKFAVNNGNDLTMNYKVILLPNLANNGNLWFDGWYTDSTCTAKITNYKIDSDTKLYGKYGENTNNYIIKFDTHNSLHISIEPIKAQFGTVQTLPDGPIRSDCKILYWTNEYGDKVEWNFTIPAHNITLYAMFTCTHITSIDEFIDFSKYVNSINTYSDETVYLDTDVNFNEISFGPIGTGYEKCFQGTFDGQGHIISNFVMNSSSQFSGLFGYSDGLTIKNVVLDSSCSLESSYRGISDAYLGGVIGYCTSKYKPCTIENNVNMASISFSGNASYGMYIGGLLGCSYGYSDDNVYVRNCAKYGTITYSGKSRIVYCGGIVGYGHFIKTYTQNCFNYGDIILETTDYPRTGGIIGGSDNAFIENCVNYGSIYETTKTSDIGDIAGYIRGSSSSFCYWNKKTNYSAYGYQVRSNISYSISFDENYQLDKVVLISNYSGTSLVEALNAYSDKYILQGYSHWLLNKNEKDVKFTVNNGKGFTINSKIILLPSLANDGILWFDGWYTESSCVTKIAKYEINANTELYGKFGENTKSYTITFDTKGGDSVSPITAQFTSVVELPEDPFKAGCTFLHWETKNGERIEGPFTVPAFDITLYALWKCSMIKTVDDFVDFSKIINLGLANYTGEYVYLKTDIDLSGVPFEPIGSEEYYFCGTFDGEEHTISNLVINSYSKYVGLFGYLKGATIENVILDSSCSVESFYESHYSYAGGIIGFCYAENAPCTIESCVNKANVTFRGNYPVVLGGIVGYIKSSSNYKSSVDYCDNYGYVTQYGEPYNSKIGGIVGESYGQPPNTVYIEYCVNYGEVAYESELSVSGIYIDGIVGNEYNTVIMKCKNKGKISASSSIHLLSVAWVLLAMFLVY